MPLAAMKVSINISPKFEDCIHIFIQISLNKGEKQLNTEKEILPSEFIL